MVTGGLVSACDANSVPEKLSLRRIRVPCHHSEALGESKRPPTAAAGKDGKRLAAAEKPDYTAVSMAAC